MKKIIVIVFMVIIAVSSISIIDNIDTKASTKIKKKSKINKVIKSDYKYITEESDNMEELLKEENKEIINNDYVQEEIVEPVVEEPVIQEAVEEKVVKNGFIEENNNTYYYENDNLIIGEKEIDNDIYYFNEEGIMQKDIVVENCYYDENGKLYTGFKEIDGNTFYFSRDGITKGIKEIDNKKYYFDEDGHLIKNSFYDVYYLDEEGVIVTGEREIGGRVYIFDENGVLKNGFQVIDGNTYFLDENNNKLKGLQLIDNIRYYFDFETGILIKKDVKSIIDISSWQGDIDFEKVKKSNLIDGVIVRIGYGTTNTDEPVLDNKFERNIKELKKTNIPYGIYLFGYAQNDNAAELEANFVDEIIKKYDLKLSYPIFYDAELTEFEGFKYTKTMYKKVINNFISILNKKGYTDVGVYGNLYSLTNGNLSNLQKKIPKWVAQYYKRCEYDSDYIGWQYTSEGSIPGIKEHVDLNIFY
ncbi:MAG: hypothetical protein J6O56_05095 [Bacilli bacterium]|nr:hypothetical protein [Bacilli bacterium]